MEFRVNIEGTFTNEFIIEAQGPEDAASKATELWQSDPAFAVGILVTSETEDLKVDANEATEDDASWLPDVDAVRDIGESPRDHFAY